MYLLTGVRGLVGRHAVEVLLQQGVQPSSILGVSRNAQQDTQLQELGISLMNVDITKPREIEQLPGGIETILHIAAYTDNTPRDLVENVNHHGTMNLARWAQQNKVKRFGFVSSVSVYGLKHKSPIPEDAPKHPDRYYGWTKLRAEQSLMTMPHDFHLVILRPPYITGRTDEKFAGKFVDRILRNKLPVIGSGENRLSFIHAKDVTHGFLDLFEKTTHDDIYNIESFNASYNQFFGELARGLGMKYPQKHYPYWLGYLIGLFTEFFLILQGKDTGTKVSRYRIKSFFNDRVFDTTKIREQGFTPRYTLEKTITELVEYFQHTRSIA